MNLMSLRFNIVVLSTGNEEVPGQKGCPTGSETEGSLHRNKGQSYGGTNLQVRILIGFIKKLYLS